MQQFSNEGKFVVSKIIITFYRLHFVRLVHILSSSWKCFHILMQILAIIFGVSEKCFTSNDFNRDKKNSSAPSSSYFVKVFMLFEDGMKRPFPLLKSCAYCVFTLGLFQK